MNLTALRAELEQMADGHTYKDNNRVDRNEFKGLQGRELLNKSYCRLLGRFPSEEETIDLLQRFWKGTLTKRELLSFLCESEECKKLGLDVSDLQGELRLAAEKEARDNRWIKRLLLRVKLLFMDKQALRRIYNVGQLEKEEQR